MARSKEVLHTTAAFGELIRDHNYRCLVCHQPLALLSSAPPTIAWWSSCTMVA